MKPANALGFTLVEILAASSLTAVIFALLASLLTSTARFNEFRFQDRSFTTDMIRLDRLIAGTLAPQSGNFQFKLSGMPDNTLQLTAYTGGFSGVMGCNDLASLLFRFRPGIGLVLNLQRPGTTESLEQIFFPGASVCQILCRDKDGSWHTEWSSDNSWLPTAIRFKIQGGSDTSTVTAKTILLPVGMMGS